MYHFNFISSFPSFLILNVHAISSNHEDSEKSPKKKKHAGKKPKNDTSLTHPWHEWHTSPNLKRKIPPTKNLGVQNQWIWPSCPGCPPGCLFMAENLLLNGQKYEKKNPPQRPQNPRPNHLRICHFPIFADSPCWIPRFFSAELPVTKISM